MHQAFQNHEITNPYRLVRQGEIPLLKFIQHQMKAKLFSSSFQVCFAWYFSPFWITNMHRPGTATSWVRLPTCFIYQRGSASQALIKVYTTLSALMCQNSCSCCRAPKATWSFEHFLQGIHNMQPKQILMDWCYNTVLLVKFILPYFLWKSAKEHQPLGCHLHRGGNSGTAGLHQHPTVVPQPAKRLF